MANRKTVVLEKALSIGRRIAEKREQKRYSQERLAVMVGVTRGAIAQYETGLAIPRAEKLERIAVALEIEPGWLLTGDDPDEKARAQTVNELAALEAIRALPLDQQETVIAMVRALHSHTRKKTPKG